jgi:hypothetical protein
MGQTDRQTGGKEIEREREGTKKRGREKTGKDGEGINRQTDACKCTKMCERGEA